MNDVLPSLQQMTMKHTPITIHKPKASSILSLDK